jgi:hypothetical protein
MEILLLVYYVYIIYIYIILYYTINYYIYKLHAIIYR